ncbi:hypothetical protein BWI93_11340 [Siphonobacter sp. BAB-5385]|uniref:DUF1573 domain-containing protein n=1 Tax=Siphonobacter sp. BAB-5385 TaxID=1864822 RepID=UPI000B9DF9A0|nr:DUF1573 domain-containing protein [Siphonobacter sp. BAB-5385]OZI08058.1 hypothetical protein BWI93_11340 [Siphonobacter sp. BAB-5385]
MKSKFVVGLLCWGLLFSCNTGKQETTTTDDPTKFPILKFDQPEVDLGKVTEGDTLLHRFAFKNTGNAPLVIQSASASCGCTVPVIPLKPIAPGDTSSLLVKFNSKNKVGANTKTVTVVSNTKPETTTVAFRVEVLETSTH